MAVKKDKSKYLPPEEAIQQIKKHQPLKPVYLITGEDNYFIDVVCDYFEQNVIDESLRDFDQKIEYGRDVTMQDVIGLARQVPMMSPVKLVIIKEAQDISANQGNAKEKAWELLETYLENPSEQSVLVLCYRHKKLAKNTKVYKAIEKVGAAYESATPSDKEVAEWIARYVKTKGYSITEKSALLIASTMSNDRSKLSHELDKIFTVLPAGSVINDAVIEKYMGISKEYNIFELQNAIGRRDIARCSLLTRHFAANTKEFPLQKIIPTLYRYIVDLMVYIQSPDKDDNPMGWKYEAASRNYTLSKLALCIGYLHDADLMSKGVNNTGTITDGEILKELIFKITHT
ncbi:MAG: DNA polymerase III subunit delta [Bacteroidales bacterium]|nr:DNA polymerase III subunit delta [Bacteroidales bacterium]